MGIFSTKIASAEGPVDFEFSDLDAAFRNSGLRNERCIALDVENALRLAKPVVDSKTIFSVCLTPARDRSITVFRVEGSVCALHRWPRGTEMLTTEDVDHAASWVARKVWAEYFMATVVDKEDGNGPETD